MIRNLFKVIDPCLRYSTDNSGWVSQASKNPCKWRTQSWHTGDWNPMTMIDPSSKERTGFDIDIANALASDMEYTCICQLRGRHLSTVWSQQI